MSLTDRLVITGAMVAFLILFLVCLYETVSHR